jgi:hypothetical protein
MLVTMTRFNLLPNTTVTIVLTNTYEDKTFGAIPLYEITQLLILNNDTHMQPRSAV